MHRIICGNGMARLQKALVSRHVHGVVATVLLIHVGCTTSTMVFSSSLALDRRQISLLSW